MIQHEAAAPENVRIPLLLVLCHVHKGTETALELSSKSVSKGITFSAGDLQDFQALISVLSKCNLFKEEYRPKKKAFFSFPRIQTTPKTKNNLETSIHDDGKPMTKVQTWPRW